MFLCVDLQMAFAAMGQCYKDDVLRMDTGS